MVELKKGTYKTSEAANSDVTISISGGSKKALYITHLSVSYDGNFTSNSKAITIEDTTNNEVIWKFYMAKQQLANFGFNDSPLKLPVGNSFKVTLESSGDSSINGRVNIIYHEAE